MWVATGDGDSLSIGGNHTIHMLRRNVGIKVLMFNNRIYGLTKGQYSPTSEFGKKTKSTPFGSDDAALQSAGAWRSARKPTFVARSVDVFQQHLKDTLKKAAAHKGSAYVEILQNCNIFNDGAWFNLTEKEARSEHVVQLEHGKPLIFGKNRDKGIRLNGLDLEVVQLGNGNGLTERDLLIHDEEYRNPAYAFTAGQDGRDARLPHSHRRAALLGRRRALRRRDGQADPGRHRQARPRRPRQAAALRRHLGSALATNQFEHQRKRRPENSGRLFLLV